MLIFERPGAFVLQFPTRMCTTGQWKIIHSSGKSCGGSLI